ncbi:M24 family metallopeptidase [Corynebacterium bovis]|uniref:Aminopeptidase P family protein n=2 Tax=Corynebacterium bovis TaxID=36808 RepID=A0A3R8QIJ0_9CORY|nr:aminopeptidase P family protein [Corynebacterium bovis]MBB3116464.1 Xaa-Pro aminopeptidase [Corynebacterium bovis DSM 20582 = CIP 54.80]MDK8509817.1 aminopeptidase P family protein [Corynebacterium bovis]QQC47759.1 aminopeptidase P family protein [Corynebacterium bovis]RRO81671.1 aminopeptidase P family protein [Corynebacterium bovis]RRO89492.1 aminopeptidase P family protein [Corynebacterium bovis]
MTENQAPSPSTAPAPDHAARRRAVGRRIAAAGAHQLLVTDLMNVRYLTGFTGSNAALLLATDGEGVIATDGRYDTQVRQQTSGLDIRITRDLFRELTAAAGDEAVHIEPQLAVGRARDLGDPEILGGTVEAERLVKDDAELAALTAAGELADAVFVEFIEAGGIREGITEIEAAADLEHRLRRAGADGLSFDTILASGTNAAKPHAGVSRERIVPGLVTVDFGVYLDGYASDETRTVCVGEPDARSRELFDLVHTAFTAGVQTLAPGVAGRDVDAAARRVIADAGYGEYFVHSTGHGVGLDVHEAPSASTRAADRDVLREGMTLTVEPGVYLPGETGLRIENTYIITADGARTCNPSPTELRVV